MFSMRLAWMVCLAAVSASLRAFPASDHDQDYFPVTGSSSSAQTAMALNDAAHARCARQMLMRDVRELLNLASEVVKPNVDAVLHDEYREELLANAVSAKVVDALVGLANGGDDELARKALNTLVDFRATTAVAGLEGFDQGDLGSQLLVARLAIEQAALDAFLGRYNHLPSAIEALSLGRGVLGAARAQMEKNPRTYRALLVNNVQRLREILIAKGRLVSR